MGERRNKTTGDFSFATRVVAARRDVRRTTVYRMENKARENVHKITRAPPFDVSAVKGCVRGLPCIFVSDCGEVVGDGSASRFGLTTVVIDVRLILPQNLTPTNDFQKVRVVPDLGFRETLYPLVVQFEPSDEALCPR